MNFTIGGTFSTALLALGLALPSYTAGQSTATGNGMGTTAAQVGDMVPARAALQQTVDSKKMEDGKEFRAKLPEKVTLKDGQELPRGTTLVGKVTDDAKDASGKLTLSLQIDEAQLKDGKTIPVKIMIAGVFPAGDNVATQAEAVPRGEQVPNPWKPGIDKIDQIGALSGVDLHSRIQGNSSGKLVSTHKNDIKLKAGTELALAIAPAASVSQSGHTGSE